MAQSTPINLLRRNDAGSQQMMPGSQQPLQPQQLHPSQQQQMQPQFPNTGGGGGGGGMTNDAQLVDDILKEMGESPGLDQQSNINSQALHYVMDGAQVPPNKYINKQNNNMSGDDEYDDNDNSNNSNNRNRNSNSNSYDNNMFNKGSGSGMGSSIFSKIGFSLSGDTFKDKIMNNMKFPILVFIICFLISLPEFNRFLFGFMPSLLLESGQIKFNGVLLKALIGMLIFICIALFL